MRSCHLLSIGVSRCVCELFLSEVISSAPIRHPLDNAVDSDGVRCGDADHRRCSRVFCMVPRLYVYI
jgi:hypothetical protein